MPEIDPNETAGGRDVLNAVSIEQFREEGYACVKQLFSAREIEAMRAELARFQREGLIRNVATDGDGTTHSQTRVNLQICPIAPRSTFYRALPWHPKVVAAVAALIGDPFVFYLDQIFLKPARVGAGTDWHQDNAYFKVSDPTRGTAVWIALHDATVENGTIHVIPGSHRTPFPHERDPGSDHHIHCSAPEERAVPIELPAGGAAFFNFGVAHATRENRTEGDRAGLALHFLRTDYIPDDAKEKKSYAHVTGPEATGGAAEYGIPVEDAWHGEVDRVLSEVLFDRRSRQQTRRHGGSRPRSHRWVPVSIRFISLGSAHEIGDTAYFIEMDGTSVILDAGVHPRRDGRESLPHFDCVAEHDVEAFLVSHCHLDHLGALPVGLSFFPHARVFMSAASAPLAPLMLKHNVRVMERLRLEEGIRDYPLFSLDDVEVLSYVFQGMRTDRPFPIYSELARGADLTARFYDAGHILGAVGIRLESPSGSLFYTGDTSAHGQEILPGAQYPDAPVDVMITECTLGADETAEHKSRADEIGRLTRAVTEVIGADGSVLVPVFSLGRNQEMLALLHRLREEGRIPDVDIYTAGFGRTVSQVYDSTRRFSRRTNEELLLEDLEVLPLPRDARRGRHLKAPSIIVVSSGMMAPHTMSYRIAERMLPEARHGIFFVGYVDPEMPGYRVMTSKRGDTVQLDSGGETFEVACRVERFHFSAHSSRDDLIGLVDRLRPRTLVIVHGERDAADWMRCEVERKHPGTRIVVPEQEQGIRLL